MEHSAITPRNICEPAEYDLAGPEERAAPRFTLLIKAARLIAAQGEFVCVIRDVSETGMSIRLFHACPSGDQFQLDMPNGGSYALSLVWERDHQAGFEFAKPVDVAQLIRETEDESRTGLRLGLFFPVTVSTLTHSGEAIVENMSRQGARLRCEEAFAIDQNLRIKGGRDAEMFKEVRAKVRWRKDDIYGVVFDDTLSLGDFARLAAQLQEPALLSD